MPRTRHYTVLCRIDANLPRDMRIVKVPDVTAITVNNTELYRERHSKQFIYRPLWVRRRRLDSECMVLAQTEGWDDSMGVQAAVWVWGVGVEKFNYIYSRTYRWVFGRLSNTLLHTIIIHCTLISSLSAEHARLALLLRSDDSAIDLCAHIVNKRLRNKRWKESFYVGFTMAIKAKCVTSFLG